MVISFKLLNTSFFPTAKKKIHRTMQDAVVIDLIQAGAGEQIFKSLAKAPL